MQERAILLAEDDAVSRAIVRHVLAALPGVEIVETADGREALAAALDRRFDLLIVDQNMPHITGDRLIRYLRASRNPNTSTPVIRFTADPAAVAEVKAGRLAGDLVVPKPIRGEELLAVVESCFGRLTAPSGRTARSRAASAASGE